MYRRKSGFLTFMFSLLPGAGHMYLGLMKNGLSLMGLFFFVTFLASWLNIGPLMFIVPVIWFYSFFDCLNKSAMSDEEFAVYKDEYLFSLDLVFNNKNLSNKKVVIVGFMLLFFGGYLLLGNAINFMTPFFPTSMLRYIDEITVYIPKVLASFAIIALGIHLILGKRKESEEDD